VHDQLEELGWEVLIADAAKVKGLAPLACKTDKIDARVLAVLSQRDLVPEIWLPDPSIRRERELARFRLHLVKHRSMLKHRIHATLITFGHPCPVSDLFGVEFPRFRGHLMAVPTGRPERMSVDAKDAAVFEGVPGRSSGLRRSACCGPVVGRFRSSRVSWGARSSRCGIGRARSRSTRATRRA
jgi:hypothetical protein